MSKSRNELTTHRASLPALTGIRFLAAMAVVFYHSQMPQVLEHHHLLALGHIIANGNLAVPLFFVLSGFILAYTYADQVRIPQGFRRFWEARFARVWPLYFVSLLLSGLVNHTTPPPLPALATLFMVQAWSPTNKGMAASWNFVCWTLSTEAFFYLIFPFVQSALERRRSRTLLCSLVVVLVISVYFSTATASYVDQMAYKDIPLAVVHVPDFLVGICCGNFFLRRRAMVRAQGAVSTLIPGRGLWTWTATVFSLFLLCHPGSNYTAWIPVSFAALLLGLAAERSLLQWFLSTRTLIISGQVSYGIYLLQWPCKSAVNRACDFAHIQSSDARFGIDCIVLILLSAAAFYGIEEPMRKIIRSWFARLQTKPVA